MGLVGPKLTSIKCAQEAIITYSATGGRSAPKNRAGSRYIGGVFVGAVCAAEMKLIIGGSYGMEGVQQHQQGCACSKRAVLQYRW